MGAPVSESCAVVAKSEKFWRATRQSNLTHERLSAVKASKVWFCSHVRSCFLAYGAVFHSVCQVWLSSGPPEFSHYIFESLQVWSCPCINFRVEIVPVILSVCPWSEEYEEITLATMVKGYNWVIMPAVNKSVGQQYFPFFRTVNSIRIELSKKCWTILNEMLYQFD